MNSIGSRISIGFYALSFLLAVLSAFTFDDLVFLETHIQQGSTVSSLVESLMEVRRFEKNYFLYQQDSDLDAGCRSARQAQELLAEHRPWLDKLCAQHPCAELSRYLGDYEAMLKHLSRVPTAELESFEVEVRAAGHRVTELAQGLSRLERENLALVVSRSSRWLLWSVLGVGALGAIVGPLLARSVVRPLRQLETSLALIAEGRFDHLEVSSRDREILSFTRAFNRMLAELETRRRQLLHTEKLASLGVLVSGVAHELNNPLANISSSCQLALEELGQVSTEELREWLQQIDSETERARRILLTILDFARRRPVQIGEIAPAELLERILMLMRSQLRGRTEVENTIPGELRVLADAQQLQQVFVNLIKNAQKPGGELCHVQVSGWSCTRESCRIPADALVVGNPQGCDQSRPLAVISIEDDGPGIAPEVLPRIFDPFFTTKEVGQGLGLGLYIVQEIIRDLGGCIAVSSRPGRGTSFLIRLPCAGEV